MSPCFRPLRSLMCGLLGWSMLLFGLAIGNSCSNPTPNQEKTKTESPTSDGGSLFDTTNLDQNPPADRAQPPDQSTQDRRPDTITPDTITPDTITPDTAKPDTSKPDTTTPDTTKPDTASITCKHDCECKKHHLNCEMGTCQPTKRINRCLACDDPACPVGDLCLRSNGSIGSCPGAKSCKNDCDCKKDGLNCEGGTCAATDRINLCPDCGTIGCTKGNPCTHPDGSIGTCSGIVSCIHDCECKKINLNCDNGECSPTKRMNRCPACGSSECVDGEPCYDQSQGIGVCGSKPFPSCTDKNCPMNTVCQNPNGTLGRCCCSTAGCNQGSLCCPATGIPPLPGFCGQRCFVGSQCPPPPP